MHSPSLTVPARRASAWVAEADPKYARAWLESLPLANAAESAGELYQALYASNRTNLKLQTRLELLALYEPVVGAVCKGLQAHLQHAAAPLPARKRQLAEFLRRLHIEMAYGYKHALRDMRGVRVLLRRKSRAAVAIERALYHLGEVLLRSYAVYQPYPNGAWREVHELYRLAESMEVLSEETPASDDGATILQRYLRTLLLGLCNPYQLPQNAVQQVNEFLRRWAELARLTREAPSQDAIGRFLVDLSADAPPVPVLRSRDAVHEHTRLLDTRALLQTLQRFVFRLEAGEPVDKSGLGVDCLDSACIDLLRRMTRALGEGARRRFARRQRSTTVFVCSGIGGLHFFSNGQRPFDAYARSLPWLNGADAVLADDVAFVDLDRPEVNRAPSLREALAALPESHRLDRWQLRDISPQGMALTRQGDTAPVRVGELIGVQQASDLGRWRAAVIRWVKSPAAGSVEIGVEVLAGAVTPVVLRKLAAAEVHPGLRLPAAESMHRPATILAGRGLLQPSDEIELIEEDSGSRRVRVLRLLECTGAFEQVVFAETMRSARRA